MVSASKPMTTPRLPRRLPMTSTPGIAAFPLSRRSRMRGGLSDPALRISMEIRLRRRIQFEVYDLLDACWNCCPEVQGTEPEENPQSQQETIKNGGRGLALSCCKKSERKIPSIDQNPFGRPIRANHLFPFSRKEEDDKVERWEQPRQRWDLRVEEEQEKVRCALLARKPLIACLPVGERSFTKPFRPDIDQVGSISPEIAPQQQHPLPRTLQAGCDGRPYLIEPV